MLRNHLILPHSAINIFKHLAIHEANIIQAFDDFFNSLPSSDYVLSKAETIAGIEAIIRDYGSSLAPDML